MIEVLKALHEVVKRLHLLKDVTHSFKDSDVESDYICTGYQVQHSFSVKESDNPAHQNKQINFVLSRSMINNMAASVQNLCSLSVVFDTAWYFNSISKIDNKCSLNNIPESNAYFVTSEESVLAIQPHQITEEWMFQLLTLHDIPFFEDMVEYNEIRNTINALPFKMSFSFNYDERYVITFLDTIQGYLDDTC